MPSTMTRPPVAPSEGRPVVDDLLVLWQLPETREITPIGRLRNLGDHFQFAYAVGASRVEGFRPLPGLRAFDRVYRSRELPQVFGQRTLMPSRPDFESYVARLGLEPELASPWEQIVRSGGHRQGDTLQVMPMPVVRDRRVRSTFLGNGVRWISKNRLCLEGVDTQVSEEDQETALLGLHVGDVVTIARDVGNTFDEHACLILAGSTPVARVPRVLTRSFRELLQVGQPQVLVAALGDPAGSPHLRITLTLDTPAPQGFAFDRDGLWEPITGWEEPA